MNDGLKLPYLFCVAWNKVIQVLNDKVKVSLFEKTDAMKVKGFQGGLSLTFCCTEYCERLKINSYRFGTC